MKLQIPQLIGLAQNAGFQGDDLATAVAVALAESGGDPSAYNPEKQAGAASGKGSFGLWQIYLTAHPEYAGQNLFDPATNAAAAFAVYSGAGGSFGPWSTFKNGAYLARLDAVNQTLGAASQSTQVAQDSTSGGTSGGAADSADSVDQNASFSPDGGDTLTMFVVGAVALWAAMKIFS